MKERYCSSRLSVATITSSVLIYHFYEKVYLKMNKTSVILLTAFLIISNAFVQYSTQNHEFWTQKFSSEVQNTIDQNKVFLETRWEFEPFSEQCFDEENPESMDPSVKANLLRNCHLKVAGWMEILKCLIFRKEPETHRFY